MKNNLKDFLVENKKIHNKINEFLGPDDLNNLNELLISKGVDWPHLLHYKKKHLESIPEQYRGKTLASFQEWMDIQYKYMPIEHPPILTDFCHQIYIHYVNCPKVVLIFTINFIFFYTVALFKWVFIRFF